MWVHLEPLGNENWIATAVPGWSGWSNGTHTLTRESQDVVLEMSLVALINGVVVTYTKCILVTSVFHWGQLNSTTSTIPVELIPQNRMCVLYAGIVSSWLAHMSPSSPVSVGMCPSSRTPEAGSWQINALSSLLVISEQFPVAEDPFTDCGSGITAYRDGSVGIPSERIICSCYAFHIPMYKL